MNIIGTFPAHTAEDIEKFETVDLPEKMGKVVTYLGDVVAKRFVTTNKIEFTHEFGRSVLFLGSAFHTLGIEQKNWEENES